MTTSKAGEKLLKVLVGFKLNEKTPQEPRTIDHRFCV